MNIRFLSKITAIIAMLFAVASMNAQEAKTMFIMKNGVITHEVAVSDAGCYSLYRSNGFSVRPVAEK